MNTKTWTQGNKMNNQHRWEEFPKNGDTQGKLGAHVDMLGRSHTYKRRQVNLKLFVPLRTTLYDTTYPSKS